MQLDDVYKYHDTKIYHSDILNIESYIKSTDSTLQDWKSDQLVSVTSNYNSTKSEFENTWDQYYTLCESLGDFICLGQTADEYANSSILADYGISYEDSLAILDTEYLNNQQLLEYEFLVLRDDALLSKKYEYEKQIVITLPMRFSWNFGDGSSISTYWEHQWRNVELNHDATFLDGRSDNSLTSKENYYNQYLTVSYRHPSKWSLTLFYDGETHEKKMNGNIWSEGYKDWIGADFTFDLNSSSQISVFYGSQKGGRICANGICADQPGFKDGFKLTYRSFF